MTIRWRGATLTYTCTGLEERPAAHELRRPLARAVVLCAGLLLCMLFGKAANAQGDDPQEYRTGGAPEGVQATDAQRTTPLASASASGGETLPWFRQTPEHGKFALIITGAAASPEIRQRFQDWSADLYQALLDEYGYPPEHIQLLIDDGDNVGRLRDVVNGSSRIVDVQAAIDTLQQQAGDGDQLTVFLVGHGSATFGEAKFNNVGPDMTGAEFAAMLDVFQAQDLVIINTASASFEFSRELSALGRIVISATRSPAERYDPVFAGYFIEALQDHRADLDRNGMVSILEAFNFASGRVAEWYREQGRLATEHAVLDDNGDGMFSREPGAFQGDGLLAQIAYVDVVRADEDKTSAEALTARAQMQALERDIIILRNQKDNYLDQDYWDRLESLLIDLALATRRYHASP